MVLAKAVIGRSQISVVVLFFKIKVSLVLAIGHRGTKLRYDLCAVSISVVPKFHLQRCSGYRSTASAHLRK